MIRASRDDELAPERVEVRERSYLRNSTTTPATAIAAPPR
jgi:hypothetical protein